MKVNILDEFKGDSFALRLHELLHGYWAKQTPRKRYGPNDPRRIRRVTRVWGERCPDYEPTCASCQAWRIFKQTGDIPTLERVHQVIDGVQE